jgi:hypothetical protein
MPLDKHQLLHIKALIADAIEEGRLQVRVYAENVKNTKNWPVGAEHPCDIHDFVEKVAVQD